MNKEIVHSNNWFDVVDINFEEVIFKGVINKKPGVAILPYIKEDGKIVSIGLNDEMNPLWSEELTKTAITGGIEDDELPLCAAIRELQEESGYKNDNPDDWQYLGMLRTSKIVYHDVHCFAVNVSKSEKEEKKGDGTELENRTKFIMMKPTEVAHIDDCFLLSLLMKFFVYNYSE